VIRLPAGLALVGVVGLVLGTNASGPVAVLVGVGATLGFGGIVGDSFSLIGASASLIVVAYSLALGVAAPAPGIMIPVVIGLGLTLLLVTGEAATRGRGAPVAPRVLGAWLRDATGTVGLAGVVGIALGAGGSTVIVGLPVWGYPLVAAIAALAVVVGTGRALIVRGHGGRIDDGEDA
jgi:hypothetical protein